LSHLRSGCQRASRNGRPSIPSSRSRRFIPKSRAEQGQRMRMLRNELPVRSRARRSRPASRRCGPGPAVTVQGIDWWSPERHADRRPALLMRNRILSAFRAWFSARDFVEVDAACLQVSPGNEAHLSAFATEAIGASGTPTPLFLHTSPEFACKKLLAAGETRLFSVARVFR